MTDGLSGPARDRLARFAVAFDRLDASEYVQFADEHGDPERLRAAMEAARTVAGSGRRMAALEDATASARDAAMRAYSRRQNLADTFLLYQTVPDTTADRARFMASLERAVVALVLWEDLEPDDLDVLVGPWAEIVEGTAPA
jgi:hypothetical protein